MGGGRGRKGARIQEAGSGSGPRREQAAGGHQESHTPHQPAASPRWPPLAATRRPPIPARSRPGTLPGLQPLAHLERVLKGLGLRQEQRVVEHNLVGGGGWRRARLIVCGGRGRAGQEVRGRQRCVCVCMSACVCVRCVSALGGVVLGRGRGGRGCVDSGGSLTAAILLRPRPGCCMRCAHLVCTPPHTHTQVHARTPTCGVAMRSSRMRSYAAAVLSGVPKLSSRSA